MDRIPPRPGRVTWQWQNGRYDLNFDRVITRVHGTEVTIDTGHGWTGAQTMFWNSPADGIICESPLTARDWPVGSRAYSYRGDCPWHSTGTAVEPRSLYLKQLEERLRRHR